MTEEVVDDRELIGNLDLFQMRDRIVALEAKVLLLERLLVDVAGDVKIGRNGPSEDEDEKVGCG